MKVPNLLVPISMVGACLIFATASASTSGAAQEKASVEADHPQYQVDAEWPKQLPYRWKVGQIAGVAVGPNDHIWILHRPVP